MGIHVTITMFRFIFFLIQTFHFLVANSTVVQSHTERQLRDINSGFINIDCGSPAGSHYNQANGLTYTSDENYTSTGENIRLSTDLYESTNPQDLFTTLRSFPEGVRNCYELSPLKPNNTYLIRASFLYGNYDGMNSLPTFDIYIDVNLWHKLTVVSADSASTGQIIHVATSESIDVCLVNIGKGTPFISALELRPLDGSSYPASSKIALDTVLEVDVGRTVPLSGYTSASQSGCSELKDDAYDRVWCPISFVPGYKYVATNEPFDASEDNPLKVPASVLMTAFAQNDSTSNMKWPIQMYDPTDQIYIFWHFAELELLGSNQTREFNIFIPGYETLGPIKPKYLQVTTIASPRIFYKEQFQPFFTLEKTNDSTHFPIFNGMEMYRVIELPASPTNSQDASAIAAIKEKYAIRVWQGDPCLPKNYQWDGLNCTYYLNNPPRITSLSLSNLSGEIPPSLVKLTSLQYLNLSNNGFTGKIPEFLAHMPSLNVIDLSGNNLSGPVPQGLAEKASNNSIDLRLQGNPIVCNTYPPCEKKLEANKKRRHLIIPMVLSVLLLLLLLIIGIMFLAFKVTKKQEGFVGRTIKSRNKQFKYSDIMRITNNLRKVLGRGGFGTVYYGVLQDGTQVAVKVLNNTSSTITLKQFCAEAELLTRIHHVNLVSLIGYCDEHTNMVLVYEFMSCGNLQMHLSERNEHPLSWKTRLQVSVDVAQGLEYLHSSCKPPILHRDIKPANILLDEMGHAKIADFGLSRFFDTNNQGGAVSTDFAGTRGYLDPECCKLITSWSEKSDVYAFGIVLLQLLTGKPALIKNTDDEDAVVHVDNWMLPMIESGDVMAIVDKRLQGDLDVNSAWKFLEIAMECVKPTGDQRPRMSEVVADLKLCYASEEKKNASFEGDDGVYYNSNQAFDSDIVTSPSAR